MFFQLLKRTLYKILMYDSKVIHSDKILLDNNKLISEFVTVSNQDKKIHFKFYKDTVVTSNFCTIYTVEAYLDHTFPAELKLYNEHMLLSVTIFLNNPDIQLLSEILLDRFLKEILDNY